MKKTIALCALVLSILAGLVSGSLALYQKSVDVGAGSVVAKKFTITAAGSTGYEADVLIAPTESVTAAFTVSNFSGTYVTETGMDLNITVTIGNASGKTAIPHITAALLDADNNVIGSAVNNVTDGVGTITLSVDHAFLPSTAATLTYKIKLIWESHSDDINYQGPNYGTAYSVTVTGIQDI